jgi:iron(III) transport system permease protein
MSTAAVLLQTVFLALVVTAASAAIAVPLAWLTVRTDLPGRRIWSLLSVLPIAIPSYVAAYLMVAFLGPRGLLVHWLESSLGSFQIPSLYGFPGAVIVLTLLCYPYIFLNVRAALLGLDSTNEEAARSLGEGPWRTFWRVTLPQLRPAIAAGSLLVCLYVLRDFGAVSILRYDTLTRSLYLQYKSAFDRSAAAALALVLVALTLGILALELRMRGRGRYDRSPAGGTQRQAPVQLGRWRWPALAFCASIATTALVIPAVVLFYWLVRGVQAGERLAPLLSIFLNSLLVSALAAAVILLAALPVAILDVRHPGRWSRRLERLAYSGYALPGMAVALALVFLGANWFLPFYQTLPMLVLAYLILFLPQAVGALRASLLQIHPNLEEAGRALGKPPLQVFMKITLPLARPGVLAGLALVFLTTIKELPATLILSPLGFRTLATAVWSSVSEAFFAQAAGPALLLILASSLPMVFFLYREQR